MTSKHPLDEATELQLLSAGLYAGKTSHFYSNFGGPFGGFTAAVILRPVLEDPRRKGVPVALTVNYCAAITEGGFEIQTREIRTGRSTQHWLVELRQGQTTAATASIVFGERRAVWSHHPAKPPELPPPETLPVFHPPRESGWLKRYEMRFAEGAVDFQPRVEGDLRPARSALWMKDAPDRQLDYLALAAMSDAFLIRSFLVRGVFVPVGTVTLSTYFHGNAESMAAQGAEPLLCTADAHLFADGFADQIAHLWGGHGKLLATSTQIVWYQE